jgi:transcriptional regulator with XRE-family HTH domain
MSRQIPVDSMAYIIKRIRQSLGETQEQFAKRFEGANKLDTRGHNAVYHWERGIQKSIPSEVAYWIFTQVSMCDKCQGHGFIVTEESQ